MAWGNFLGCLQLHVEREVLVLISVIFDLVEDYIVVSDECYSFVVFLRCVPGGCEVEKSAPEQPSLVSDSM